jgi:hypothetical protein
MKRLSVIALLLVAAVGLTYAFAFASNGPVTSSATAGCDCAVCGCPDCDGTCCATATKTSLPKKSCCSIFTDPANFPTPVAAAAGCGCENCKCPNCDGKNCSCGNDCKCGKCGCKKS